MKIVLETERLYLRELNLDDAPALSEILMDPESMRYYPRPFTYSEVEDWIRWNVGSYKQYRHGLWAVIKKAEQAFIGDCGITMQNIDGEELPELGFHIKHEYRNQGFASEAARGCIQYAFDTLHINKVFSYTKYDNFPSLRVAEKCGMKFVKKFVKHVTGEEVTEHLSCIEKK